MKFVALFAFLLSFATSLPAQDPLVVVVVQTEVVTKVVQVLAVDGAMQHIVMQKDNGNGLRYMATEEALFVPQLLPVATAPGCGCATLTVKVEPTGNAIEPLPRANLPSNEQAQAQAFHELVKAGGFIQI
jgi:hypothetical protein